MRSPVDRHRGREDESAVGGRAGVERAAEQRHALAQPDQPVAAGHDGERRRGGRGRCAPRSRRSEPSPREPDADGAAGRVLERVGQRFLHDPVGRELDADRKPGRDARRARGRSRGRRARTRRPAPAGPPRRAADAVPSASAPSRCSRSRRPVSPSAARPARSTSADGRRRRRGIADDEIRGQRRLHDHDAERVREHVVELAGDPLALRGGAALGLELLLDAGALRLGRELRAPLDASLERDPDRPRHDGERDARARRPTKLSRVAAASTPRSARSLPGRSPARPPRASAARTGRRRSRRGRAAGPRGRLVRLDADQRGRDGRSRRRRRGMASGKRASRAQHDGGEPVRAERRPQRAVALPHDLDACR